MPDIKRIVAFDYFRAVAIMLIVLGHCGYNWRPSGPIESAFENLIKGTTATFVFISGFFFYKVFYPKFVFSLFMTKKVKSIFLPYLAMSCIGMAVMWFYDGRIVYHYHLADDPSVQNIANFLLNLATGYTLPPYWYVPFVMLLFLASPVFIWMIGKSMRTQLLLTVIFFGVAMYVQRPTANLNPFHSLLYFAPIYMMGIIYGQRQSWLEHYLSLSKGIVLSGTGILTVLVLMESFNQHGNLHKDHPWTYNGFDLMIVQNVFLLAFLLGLMKKIEKKELFGFPFIAKCSFAIFFIHPLVINLIERHWTPWSYAPIGVGSVFLYFFLVMTISVICAVTVKKILGEKSRYMIGW